MWNRGQALITLLFYVLIVITISSAAVILIGINSRSETRLQQGDLAYYIAESGAENAFLQVLRDPLYTGEANLPIGEGTATTVVVQGNPTTITSTGTVSGFVRKVQVITTYTNGYYTITSWKEIQ